MKLLMKNLVNTKWTFRVCLQKIAARQVFYRFVPPRNFLEVPLGGLRCKHTYPGVSGLYQGYVSIFLPNKFSQNFETLLSSYLTRFIVDHLHSLKN